MKIGVTCEIKKRAACLQRTEPGWDRDSEHLSPAALAEILSALRELGHDPVLLGSAQDLLAAPRSVREIDLCANLSVGYGGVDTKVYTAALLDLLKIEYVGSPPHALTVTRDKAVMKAIAAAAGVKTPVWARVDAGDEAVLRAWRIFPSIVKPVHESSSVGIDYTSVVYNDDELTCAVRRVWSVYDQAALVEQYIEGIDVEVPLVAGPDGALGALGAVAVVAIRQKRGVPAILTSSIVYRDSYVFADPADHVRWRSKSYRCVLADSLTLARAAGVRDYGRCDFRVTREGDAWFIEASTHPYVARHSSFCHLFRQRGRSYVEMWGALIEAATVRLAKRSRGRQGREEGLVNAPALSSARPVSGMPQEVIASQQGLSPDDADGFVGRDYLFGAVESFVEGKPCGYLVIQGESGAGKTAFIAEYARRTGCVVHFNDRSAGRTRVSQIIEGIGAQLRDRFGLSGYAVPGWSRRAGALGELLNRSARRLAGGEPLVIAIDAVDEAEASARGSFSDALGLPDPLPDGVFFVVTRRRVVSPPAVASASPSVDMGGEYDKENDADVRAFLGAVARRPGARAWIDARSLRVDEVVDELARRSRGNFMYLRRVLDGIGDGRYEDRALADLPRDLTSYHDERWLALSRRTALPASLRDAVTYVLAETKSPVSRSDIMRLTGASEDVVSAVIDEIVDLLRVERAGDRVVYSVAHASFREFLYRQDSVQAAGVALAGDRRTVDDGLRTLLGEWSEAT